MRCTQLLLPGCVHLLAGMPTAQQSRRRKRGKSAIGSSFTQHGMKLNGHLYVHRAMSLELQAAAHKERLQAVEAELLAARICEQVRHS
jgi:hypothetical protein